MQSTAGQQRCALQAPAAAGRLLPSRPAPAARRDSKVSRKTSTRRAAAEEVQSASSNGVSSNTANPMEFDELTDIIRMVHETDIVELELKSKKFSFALRKREAVEVPEPMIIHAPAPMAAAAAAAAPAAPAAAPSPTQQHAPQPVPTAPQHQVAPVVEGAEVISPMAGNYYRSPAPGEPPFCRTGDQVKKGQVIGIIEAMKLMNEIEADVSGEVVKLVVDNGTPVTPGQVLMIIKPE